MGVLRSGTMDTSTRCFDLLCFGKCTSGNSLKLNIQSTEEIPNLITKNADGDIVFQEPRPMCTIRAPKGHNVWVNIELHQITTKASDYICLGIRKRGEDDYYDVLYTGNLSRYVDLQEDDVVELVPLISSSKLPTYTSVKAGDSAKIIGESTYDFGSVYRLNVTLNNSRSITQSCDLRKINSSFTWNSDGTIGVGSLLCEDEKLRQNQLLMININGQLARSPDGTHWFDIGSVRKGSESATKNNNWYVHPIFGNGIWCIINWNSSLGIRRSIDYGKTWSDTVAKIGARNLNFGNGVFMVVTDAGFVYTSTDAECWTQIGIIPHPGDAKILIYGNSKWIFGDSIGHLYCSKDGCGTWEELASNLSEKIEGNAFGGCYADGYFHIAHNKTGTLKSLDGSTWEAELTFNTEFVNVTYFKNKLYAFCLDGTNYTAEFFNPGGTM